jgi:hypothetical protein
MFPRKENWSKIVRKRLEKNSTKMQVYGRHIGVKCLFDEIAAKFNVCNQIP